MAKKTNKISANIADESTVEADLYRALVGFNFGEDNRRVEKGDAVSELEIGADVLKKLLKHDPPVLELIEYVRAEAMVELIAGDAAEVIE